MTAECYWSVSKVYGALRDGSFSPSQALDACLGQIEKHNTELGAFLAVDAPSARQAIDTVTLRPERPLAGIPYALKDNINVLGWRTTCHSRSLGNVVADRDADVAKALRDSGAILIGKNSMHELATGGPSFDLPWPPARNPWDPSRHPGGSSSGSGVAVATGMAYFALGTDTGGSVRHPASACGIYGFKPSYDVVSATGIVPLSVSCDHVGVLCRSALDIPLIMSSIAARSCDRKAHQSLALNPHATSLKGCVVGVIDSFSGDLDADHEMLEALDELIKGLTHAGSVIKRIAGPSLARFSACSRKIVYTEAYGYFGDAISTRPQDFGRRTRDRIAQGRNVEFLDYLKAREEQRLLQHELETALDGVDVAMCLSSLQFPCQLDDPESIRRTYDLQARVPFSLTGLPAISVPVGLSSRGLPIGLQAVSGYGGDLALLAFSQSMEHVGLCGYCPPNAPHIGYSQHR